MIAIQAAAAAVAVYLAWRATYRALTGVWSAPIIPQSDDADAEGGL